MPTLAGYIAWIYSVIGIPPTELPSNSPVIAMSFNISLEIVNLALSQVSPTIYELAVYNLAGDSLLNYAPNQPNSTYFSELRQQLDLTGFVPGVISGSSDESTSQTILTPDAMKNLTLMDLQNLKTPYGRQYLAFAQAYGTLWGLT